MRKITETIATKDDVANPKEGIQYELEGIRQIISSWKMYIILWLFASSITQIAGTFVIFYLALKK